MATGPVKGMDFDAVEQWGNRVTGTEVGNVRQIVSSIVAQARQLQWVGTDYERFMGTEVAAVETALKSLEQAMTEMGGAAVRNAGSQRSTSATA